MKTKCLFLFLLFQLHHCVGQEVKKEVPYFVMAYVYTEDDIFQIEYAKTNGVNSRKHISLLLSIKNDRFKVIDTLSSENRYMWFLTNISGHKYLYFEENNQHQVSCISILDYSKKLIKKRFIPIWDPNFTISTSSWAILKNDSIVIYKVPFIGYGRDNNLKRINFNFNDIENVYNEGTSGYEHAGFDAKFLSL